MDERACTKVDHSLPRPPGCGSTVRTGLPQDRCFSADIPREFWSANLKSKTGSGRVRRVASPTAVKASPPNQAPDWIISIALFVSASAWSPSPRAPCTCARNRYARPVDGVRTSGRAFVLEIALDRAAAVDSSHALTKHPPAAPRRARAAQPRVAQDAFDSAASDPRTIHRLVGVSARHLP